jgi:hypothetical protein
MMAKIGITINLVSIVALITFLIHYMLNLPISKGSVETVSIVGGDSGPTTVFLTAKVDHTILILGFYFLIVFMFNLYSFVRMRAR